ncbi:hypothetical protein [Azospirillum argentinense]|uniref:hypothetical protein n=1 Tax=Azospirillum argentinense TaxID=2970906 RepID=UPI001186D498|nr:hypothetical protein [Azospirillum argentinense]EZQ06412.1 hypothetical protein ABAZ39_15385 [Azospirillum argentinense]
MFDAWRYSDPRFESYYRTQNPEAGPRYEAARYLLKFIKTPVACLTERVPGLPREEQNVTLFIGVWEVVGLPRPCGLGERDELLDIDAHAAGYIRYDPAMLHPSEALADLIGRLECGSKPGRAEVNQRLQPTFHGFWWLAKGKRPGGLVHGSVS